MPGRTRIAEAEIVARDNTAAGTKSAISNFEQLHAVVRDNWWGAQHLGNAFAGLGGLIAGGFGVAAKASIDFETGMAGVARTTRSQGESAADAVKNSAALGDSLREIARTSPVAVDRLTAIAEEAGALGVSRSHIADFTKSITELVATTNLTDESATQLARIEAVMNISAAATSNLGSAILYAGRSTAATESEIVRFAQYLAPVAAGANASTGELIGMSAVLASLGVRADAGRTAISKTIQDMRNAFRAGGKDAATFAQVAGMSMQDFSSLVQKDGFRAVDAFVQGLHRMGVGSNAVNGTLGDLGIVETRQVQTLRALAAAYDNTTNDNVHLSTQMDRSQLAFEQNTELMDAYKVVTQTTGAQIQVLKNQVHDLSLGLAGILLPAVRFIVDALSDFVAGIEALPPGVRPVVVGLVAATGAIALMAGAALLLAPRIILIMGAFRAFTGAYSNFARSAGNASAILATAGNNSATGTLRAAYAFGRMSTAQRDAAFQAYQEANAQKVANVAHAEAIRINDLYNLQKDAEIRLSQQAAAVKAGEARETAALTTQKRAEQSAFALGARIRTLEIQQSAQMARAMSLEADGRGALAARARASAAATEATIAGLRGEVIARGQAAVAASEEAATAGAQVTAAKVEASAVNARIAKIKELIGFRSAEASAAIRQAETDIAASGASSKAATFAGFLGKAVGKLSTPLLIATTLMSVFGVGLNRAGDAQKELAASTADSAQMQADFARAVAAQKGGTANAVRDYTLMQLKQIEGVDTAKRYGTTLLQLQAIISGTASQADTAQFAANLSKGAANGDAKAAQLFGTLGKLRQQVMSTGKSADYMGGAMNGAAGDTSSLGDAAAATKKQLDTLRETNDRINNALLALPGAILSQREAATSAAEAQKHYNDVLAEGALEPEKVAKAERDLEAARYKVDKANRAVADAERKLTTARADGLNELADAQSKLADEQDKLYNDTQKVADLEKEVAALRDGPSADDLRKATEKLTAANVKLQQSQLKVRDAQYMVNYLQAEGASARDVEEARLNLDDANVQLADSTNDVTDAQKELNDLKSPDPKVVADKERELAAARRQVASDTRDVQTAEQDLDVIRSNVAADQYQLDAEENLRQARSDAADAVNDVRDAEKTLNDQRSGSNHAKDVADAEMQLEQALLRQAEANVEVQKQTALSHGELFGAGREAQALAEQLGILGGMAGGGQIAEDFARFRTALGGARADIAATSDDVSALPGDVGDALGEIPGIIDGADPFANAPQVGSDGGKGFIDGMIDYFKHNGVVAIATGLIALLVGGLVLAALGTAAIAVGIAALAAAAVFALVYWLSDPKHREEVANAFRDMFGALKDAGQWVLDELGKVDWVNVALSFVGMMMGPWGPSIIQWLKDNFHIDQWIRDAFSAVKDTVAADTTAFFIGVFLGVPAGVAAWLWDHFNVGTWIKSIFDRDEGNSKSDGEGWGTRVMEALKNAAIDYLLGFTPWGILRSIFNRDEGNAKADGGIFGGNIGWALINGLLGPMGGLGSMLGRAIYDGFSGLPNWIKGPINVAISYWDWFIDWLSGLTINFPSMTIPYLGTIGGWSVGLGYLRSLRIPMLADGGIAVGPTMAMVGEGNSSELILPLDKFWAQMEPLAKMASSIDNWDSALQALVSGGSGNTYNNITVNVESGADAQEIGREILWNQMTRIH